LRIVSGDACDDETPAALELAAMVAPMTMQGAPKRTVNSTYHHVVRGCREIVLALAGCGRIDFDPASDGSAVPVLVQSAAVDTAGVVAAMLTIGPTGSGNLLVVASGDFSTRQPITAMTDDAGNTYVSANALAANAMDLVEIWYAVNSLPGATTLTVTSETASNRQVWFLELSDMDPSAPLDVVGVASTPPPSATPAAPPVTPTTSRSLIVSVANVLDNVMALDPRSPFVGMPIFQGNDTAYYIASASGSYGALWDAGGSGAYCASTAAFKPARR
jgi:hypothetical protein